MISSFGTTISESPSIFSTASMNIRLKERDINHTSIKDESELKKWYSFGEIIGKGVFGTVTEIKDNTSKKIWALKEVDKGQIKKSRETVIENEIKILKIVNHPHIIYLDRTFESAKNLYMIFERCNKDLGHILKKKEKFSENETRKVVKHLASALAYLHKYEIVHRDLKLENILTAANPDDPNDELYIKISDFGLAIMKCITRPEQMLQTLCGTLLYMAPEIISRSSYSKQCDVWAMGIVAYTLLNGKPPFYASNEKELSRMICTENPPISCMTASNEAKNVLTKMLTKNTVLRISASEVENHAWIRGKANNLLSDNIFDVLKSWQAMQPPVETSSAWAQALSNEKVVTDASGELDRTGDEFTETLLDFDDNILLRKYVI